MARPGDPDIPPATGRGRLSRFLPGRPRVGGEPDSAPQSAERQAIPDANPVEQIPIVPAPLGRPRPAAPPPAVTPTPGAPDTSAAATATAPPPAAEPTATVEQIPIVPAPLGRPRPVPPPPTVAPTAAAPTAAAPAPASVTPAVPPSRMPALPDTTIPMPEPVPRPMAGAPDTAPSPAVEAAALALPIEQAPEPTYEAPLQAGATSAAPPFVSTPTTPSMEAAAPVSEPESDQTGPRRRQPGQTAPEELLQVPPSVGVAADDFFDGLVRRVEGDR